MPDEAQKQNENAGCGQDAATKSTLSSSINQSGVESPKNKKKESAKEDAVRKSESACDF